MDGISLDWKENGRAPHDAPISKSRYGAPDSVARLPAWVRNEMKTVETEIKYSGYLDQQRRSMEKMRRAGKGGDSDVCFLFGGLRAGQREEEQYFGHGPPDAGR